MIDILLPCPVAKAIVPTIIVLASKKGSLPVFHYK